MPLVPPRHERLQWFRDAKLGMFIHWGCYSVLGRGEQIQWRDLMPVEEYRQLAEAFRPAADWAPTLARRAKRMGARYMALTTRHHDGYCLFDTRTHDFNAAKTGPGRDLVAEFVEAARAEDLRIGFYYSVHTWRWPGFWDPRAHPEDLPKMVEEMHEQVEELMTRYGTIDVLWYDVPAVPGSWVPGSWGWRGQAVDQTPAEFYRSAELNARVREWQPHILINNRSGLPEDFGTPEQHVTPEDDPDRAWETCMTLNYAPGWAHLRHSMADKTPGEVLYNLVNAVRLGGNFLFNVGPDADGRLGARDAETVEALGAWMERHGEAIYGTRPGGIYSTARQGPCYHYGMFTTRGSTAYLSLFYYPEEYVVLSRLLPGVKRAELLTTGEELPVTALSNARWRIDGLPADPPDPLAPVLKIEFEDEPREMRFRGAEWLHGELTPLEE
jgi:alpha-L-fucosidase